MSVFSLKSFSGGVADLTAYQLDTPTIGDVSDDEVYERDYIEVTIDNYDKEAEYEANSELITKIRYKSDNVVKVYFGSVDDDTDLDFKIRSLKVGYLASEWSDTISVKVKDRPEESDDAIINDAFSDNLDDSDSADVTNDKVTITADGGYYKEVVTEQGDDEKDWSSYQSYCELELKKMNVLDDDTTKDELVVTDDITDIGHCYITNDDYPDGVLIDVGDVDKEDGTVNELDVLGDGSCIATYNLDGDATDLSGNYDGTLGGDPSFIDGIFDKAISFDGDDDYLQFPDDLFQENTPFSLTCWYKAPDVSVSIRSIEIRKDCKIEIFTNDNVFHLSDTDGSENVSDDTWYFLYFYGDTDGAKLKIYDTDNNLIETITTSDNLLTGGDFDHDWLGRNDTDYYQSSIDQLRVFNKELSDDEVNTVYNEQIATYKADISSNELENPPKTAYFEEPSFTLSTALTKDTSPTDEDFVDEEMESFKIDTDTDLKEVTFKKVSDYSGNKFQRKFSGDEGANVTYIKSNMWKDS